MWGPDVAKWARGRVAGEGDGCQTTLEEMVKDLGFILQAQAAIRVEKRLPVVPLIPILPFFLVLEPLCCSQQMPPYLKVYFSAVFA